MECAILLDKVEVLALVHESSMADGDNNRLFNLHAPVNRLLTLGHPVHESLVNGPLANIANPPKSCCPQKENFANLANRSLQSFLCRRSLDKMPIALVSLLIPTLSVELLQIPSYRRYLVGLACTACPEVENRAIEGI